MASAVARAMKISVGTGVVGLAVLGGASVIACAKYGAVYYDKANVMVSDRGIILSHSTSGRFVETTISPDSIVKVTKVAGSYIVQTCDGKGWYELTVVGDAIGDVASLNRYSTGASTVLLQ